MKFKAFLFSLFLLLSACSNENHIESIAPTERYFSEWQNFAEPYEANDELTLDEVNKKIDAGELFYKASGSSVAAYQGTELLWEDYYSVTEDTKLHFARSYRFTGGPYYFAELKRQTPYEMISYEEALDLVASGLPYYTMNVLDPLMPSYAITKIEPSGELWTQTISDDDITITWLQENLPASTHTIEVLIPKKGETLELPQKIYSNTDYGFSFEFPAYAFSLFDKNGNETENPLAEAITVYERRVSESESHFYLAPENLSWKQVENPDGLYAGRALHVIKVEDEESLAQVLKEHWGYFCEYSTSVETSLGYKRIDWTVTPGTDTFSCMGGKSISWYDPETKTLYLNDPGQESLFGYNEQIFNLAPSKLLTESR